METDIPIFGENEYSESNYAYRWIDNNIFEQYYKNICRCKLGSFKKVLDIGCGTGQFTINVAQKLPHSYVHGLDISKTPLAKLEEIAHELKIINVHTVNDDIFSFTAPFTYDLIICSEMIHLVEDVGKLAKKLLSMLSPEGIICIRTSSPEQLFGRSTYRFFPRCRYIDLQRLKTRELIQSAFEMYCTCDFQNYAIDESRDKKTSYVIESFRRKLYSTLYLLTDKEFEDGISRMELEYAGRESINIDTLMTQYIISSISNRVK
jgi:SAM-dependent methyltransferase